MSILLLGDCTHPELQPVAATFRESCPGTSLRQVRHSRDVEKLLGADWFPDLVVVCLNDSDEFSVVDVQHVMALFPIAEWVCFYGPWCDSDGRNRDIWPAAVRLPADQAAAWWHRRSAGRSVSDRDALPLTASRGEIFAVRNGGLLPVTLAGITMGIVSPDVAWASLWREVLRRAGARVEPLPAWEPLTGTVPFRGLLWDADPWEAHRAVELQTLRNRFEGVALIAAVGFFTQAFAQELRTRGAASVISKLAPLEDSVAAICAAVQSPGDAPPLEFVSPQNGVV